MKHELSKFFKIKYLGPVKIIIVISISRDRKEERLWLSEEMYIGRFLMEKAKPVITLLTTHMKLSNKQIQSIAEENEEINNIPYFSNIVNLMYVMVCSISNLAHAVGLLCIILFNRALKYIVKWILRYLCRYSKFKA